MENHFDKIFGFRVQLHPGAERKEYMQIRFPKSKKKRIRKKWKKRTCNWGLVSRPVCICDRVNKVMYVSEKVYKQIQRLREDDQKS